MRLKRWKIYLWIGWLGFATGLCFLFVAIGFAAFEVRFLKLSSNVQGTVIANVHIEAGAYEETGTSGQTSFCQQIRYETPDGVKHVETGSACADAPRFTVGERVRLHHLNGDPASGQIDAFGAKWGYVLSFGLAGILLTLIGIGFFRHLQWRGHSLDPLGTWN